MSQPATIAQPLEVGRRPRQRSLNRSELLAALGLMTAMAIAVAAEMPWPFAAALIVGAGMLGVAVIRRQEVQLVGPLFFYDLIRLARRGRSTILRCIYALLLFAGMWATYSSRFPHIDLIASAFDPGPTLPVRKLQQFALEFVSSILMIQGGAALALTPAYLAGAIAEEKERKSLALLFTTDLRNREIILGKLFGRLLHLAGILLTGLPILCLTQLIGGVDIRFVISGFMVTGMTLLSAGSVSILCSVFCRRVLNAVLMSYALLILLSIGCACTPVPSMSSPVAFLLQLSRQADFSAVEEDTAAASLAGGLGPTSTPTLKVTRIVPTMLWMVLGYCAVHGTIALVCILAAIAQVRWRYLSEAGPPPPVVLQIALPEAKTVGGWDPVEVPAVVPARAAPSGPLSGPPPVSDHALLWKETHHAAHVATAINTMTTLLVGLVLVGAFFMVAAVLLNDVTEKHRLGHSSLPELVNPLIRSLSLLLASLWCLGLAFRAVSSVSRERDQRTLDSLLILPVHRTDILRAKWLGSILRLRGLGVCLLAVWALGLITGSLHPLGALLLALACGIHVAFLASLGIWVSLVSRNTLSAYFIMALMMLVMFAGSWSAMGYSESFLGVSLQEKDWMLSFSEIGLNPLRSWWFLGLSWGEVSAGVGSSGERLENALPATLAGLIVFCAAAWVLWLAACWRFSWEEGAGAR